MVFAAMLWVKSDVAVLYMSVIVLTFSYANCLSFLFEKRDKSPPVNSTYYAMFIAT